MVFGLLALGQLQLLLLRSTFTWCCGWCSCVENHFRSHYLQRQATHVDRFLADHRCLHLHSCSLQFLQKVLCIWGGRRGSRSKMSWHVHGKLQTHKISQDKRIFFLYDTDQNWLDVYPWFIFSASYSICIKAFVLEVVLVMSWNLLMEIRWKPTESSLIFPSSSSLLLSCLPSFKVGLSP